MVFFDGGGGGDWRDRSSGEERLLQDIAIGEIRGTIFDNLCKVWDEKHGILC